MEKNRIQVLALWALSISHAVLGPAPTPRDTYCVVELPTSGAHGTTFSTNYDSVCLRWRRRFRISNKLPKDANAGDLQATSE